MLQLLLWLDLLLPLSTLLSPRERQLIAWCFLCSEHRQVQSAHHRREDGWKIAQYRKSCLFEEYHFQSCPSSKRGIPKNEEPTYVRRSQEEQKISPSSSAEHTIMMAADSFARAVNHIDSDGKEDGIRSIPADIPQFQPAEAPKSTDNGAIYRMRNFSPIILHVSAVFLVVLLLGALQGTDAFLPRPSSHSSSVAPWGVRTTYDDEASKQRHT